MSLLLVIVTYLFNICYSVIPLDNWKSGGQASKHAYAPPAGDSATACGYLSVANYLTTHTSSFPFGYVTAVGTVAQGSQHENLFNNGEGCGACYEIECDGGSFIGNQDCICNSGSVIVQAIDLSGANPEPHFDMAFDAFDVVAGSLCGRISINYRQVACEFTNNIYITTDYNDAWSYYLNFYNVAGNGKLCGVELKSYGSNTWMQCTNIVSKWKCDDSSLEPTQLPLSFRLTDCAGNKVTATDAVNQWGNVQADLGVNFPFTGGSTSTPTTPTTFQPSKTPTTPTTLSPTNPTTPQPTNAQSNGNILLHTFGNSLGKWWYVAYLTDIANGYNINKFELQSYGKNTWLECTAVTVTVTEYQCQATTAFVLPLTVKLTETNGEIIISNDLITEYTDNIIYNFGDNFGKNAVTPLPTNANPSQTSTNNPSKSPTSKPTKRSKRPTNIPTNLPSNNPSLLPLKNPTKTPTNNPTNLPSHNPSLLPSKNPTIRPTDAPIIPGSPTKAPSNPTAKPSSNPAKIPTNIPTNIPTTKPSSNPSQTRTNIPTNNPLPTVSIAPTETETETDTPTGVSTSLNPTNTPTFKCDDTCDSDRDNDKITIKVIFKFQAWIMYDLTHIKCWLYEIFIKWFIHFEFVQYFDVCDIQIIVRGGKRNLGKNCINGPCLWDSKTRRLLQDESIGNVSVSIISNDENILQSTNGLSMINLSDILSTEITTQFDMNMDTKVEVVQESKDNDKKDNETEIFSSEIQIIIIIILIGLMVFIIGLCIICYRRYKKRKCTKKDMDTTVNMTPTDETKDGSVKTQQTNIVAVENDDNDGQNCMYEL